MAYTFPKTVAWDPDRNRPLPGVKYYAYDLDDIWLSSRLPVTDLAGNPLPYVQADSLGYVEFRQATHPNVKIADENGNHVQPLISLEGRVGDSAFEVALAEGFVGTRAEWLESLHGEDGLNAVGAPTEDPARPGIYFMDPASSFVEDPARPGIYTIGA